MFDDGRHPSKGTSLSTAVRWLRSSSHIAHNPHRGQAVGSVCPQWAQPRFLLSRESPFQVSRASLVTGKEGPTWPLQALWGSKFTQLVDLGTLFCVCVSEAGDGKGYVTGPLADTQPLGPFWISLKAQSCHSVYSRYRGKPES